MASPEAPIVLSYRRVLTGAVEGFLAEQDAAQEDRMDGRLNDTEAKIAELEALLTGDDAGALWAAAQRASLAGELRAADAMIGLDPVDQDRVTRMTALARRALERAASLGHVEAGVKLADRIYFGRQKDRAAEAWALLDRAGDLPRALYLEGLFLYASFGCEQDAAKSFDLHRRAAEAGEADAMFELYVYHAKGIGTPRDDAAAVAWCRRGAEAGNARAMANLGGFYATGNGVDQDPAQAVRWYERATEAGNGRAAAMLGVMYAIGDCVEPSDEKAREHFTIAEDLGFDWRALAEQSGLDPDSFDEG